MNEGEGRGGTNGSLLPQTFTTAEIQHNCCRFIVTGFGPFRNVPDNPTSVLIRRLRTEAEDRLSSTDDDYFSRTATPNTINNVTLLHETHILETSAECVRAWLVNLHERLISSTSMAISRGAVTNTVEKDDEDTETKSDFSGKTNVINNPTTHVNKSSINDCNDQTLLPTTVLLHLGVDSGSRQFKLEQCAYNDATFRVPDERGYQPHCECIISVDNKEITRNDMEASSPSWGQCLQTTIDLQSLCDNLRTRTKENVTISTDPGRFVCNYVYYLSLDLCHSMSKKCKSDGDDKNQYEKEEDGCTDDAERMYHALFLHVPPFGVISEDRQLNFIQQVMEAIRGRVQKAR